MPHPSNKWFIQDWGTLPNETLVVVGLTYERIVEEMKSNDFHEDVIKAFSKAKPRSGANAWCWFEEGRSLLWIEDWRTDLDHLTTLVHETNHLVFQVARDKGAEEEMEFQAYQQEYLFENIVKKLSAKDESTVCGKESLTPGYKPCKRPPHADGPCAHELKESNETGNTK
jgi:hypothetical protein